MHSADRKPDGERRAQNGIPDQLSAADADQGGYELPPENWSGLGKIAVGHGEKQNGGCAHGGYDQWRVLVQKMRGGENDENACACAGKRNQALSVADRPAVHPQ